MSDSPFLLDRPRLSDRDDIFEIFGDPRVWTHFPSGRFTAESEASNYLEAKSHSWEVDELSTWMVRETPGGPILGVCGCEIKHRDTEGSFWNLGYRFRPEVQGRGWATAIGKLAIEQAQEVRPEVPVVAYLVEHNTASAKVAQKVGLSLQHRGLDQGNPDPDVVRLVFADRELNPAQLTATMS